ncbi:hypothetical protein OUZ56_007272 [Daphnia magna]|uniref:Uncharacterized protein n=1 Tax=Daphnia magna TaxID=35525 RepID=A0ABQ9YY37_9CRUS|nr:hypothetical protein OUZ56_007272 [Daphnia magna]
MASQLYRCNNQRHSVVRYNVERSTSENNHHYRDCPIRNDRLIASLSDNHEMVSHHMISQLRQLQNTTKTTGERDAPQ